MVRAGPFRRAGFRSNGNVALFIAKRVSFRKPILLEANLSASSDLSNELVDWKLPGECGVTVYKRAVNLLEADVGDDLVALDPAAGSCFGFNSVATSVWRQLDEPKTFEQLKQALLDQYEVDADQCARELKELLDTMTDQGLVTTAS